VQGLGEGHGGDGEEVQVRRLRYLAVHACGRLFTACGRWEKRLSTMNTMSTRKERLAGQDKQDITNQGVNARGVYGACKYFLGGIVNTTSLSA
jgi:hypothetical protein